MDPSATMPMSPAGAAPAAPPVVVATVAPPTAEARLTPLSIEDRAELIYLLNEAAELEHAACCTYLFAAFSLKSSPDEGLTSEQAQAVAKWKDAIGMIAFQEMMHLSLTANLLTALGAAPHFDRPNFPQRTLFSPEFQFTLTPVNEQTIERFLYIERPDGMDIASMARDFDVGGPRRPAVRGRPIMPRPEDFATVGQLYRGIEQGLRTLVDTYGEARVFVGPPRAQATSRYFRFPDWVPEIIAVTDLTSALRAIETIVEEGEGARGDWQNAHFGRFVGILQEYRTLKAQDPRFTPGRPVLENPYPQVPWGLGADDVESRVLVNLVDDPYTGSVSDLFNAAYDAMLQVLSRFFMHSEESDAELATLCGVSTGLMDRVVGPLGELLTTLPAGTRYPGMTAGPNFLTSQRTHLTVHKAAAWVVLHERLLELAQDCGDLLTHPGAPAGLADVGRALEELAAALAPGAGAAQPSSTEGSAGAPA